MNINKYKNYIKYKIILRRQCQHDAVKYIVHCSILYCTYIIVQYCIK